MRYRAFEALEATGDWVHAALSNLGNYRVLRVQQVAGAGEPDGISGALMLSMGLRETGLRNINNAEKSDKGCFQISVRWHPGWLRQQEGCPAGKWESVPGHNAAEPDYVPRFSPALYYAITILHTGIAQAKMKGVPEKDRVQVAIAGYNCGSYSAIAGYREGNVDKYTTGKDYSAWVLDKKPRIHRWIEAHPNWKYTGQKF